MQAIKHFGETEAAGLSAATVGAAHFDLDGHPANQKMVAARLETLPKNTLCSVRHCGNHANNLVEGCTLDAVGCGVYLFLCITTMCLSMGGNFLRLIHSTPELISKYMLPPVREPPEESEFDSLVAQELKDYSVCNYKALVDATAMDEAWSSDDNGDDIEAEKKGKKRSQRYWAFTNAWDRFLLFWAGCNVWRLCDNFGPHHCRNPECCSGYDINVTIRRAIKSIVDLLWRAQPVRPTKGKWTKLGPCIDWHILTGLMGTFQKTFPLAYSQMSLKVKAATASFDGHQQEDTGFLIDVDWHAVRGSRCTKVLIGLKDKMTFNGIIILGIVLEPIRWITRWLLRRSSTVRRLRHQERKRAAPIMDFVWYEASPAVRVLQYYSQLMSGRSPRLRILWAREYDSFEEWADGEEELLHIFRRAVGVSSSWVYYRFFQLYMCYPWLLSALVDPRRSIADKRIVADAFVEAGESSPELLDDWFSLKLHDMLSCAADLFLEKYQMLLWLWSWQILCSIAQSEFHHGRNRDRAHEQD